MNEHHHEENGLEAGLAGDVFWTAAQYAAGDLPESAAEQFEELLETNQKAREALAQAVALSQSINQIEATSVTPIRRRAKYAAVGVLVVTAACLALTFVLNQMPNGGAPKTDVAGNQTTDAQRRLAMAWIAGQDIDGDEPTAIAGPMFDDDENEFELPSLAAEPSAPDWLIAALADVPAPGGGN